MADKNSVQKETTSSKGPNTASMLQGGNNLSLKKPPPFGPAAPPRRPSTQEMIDYYSRKGLDKQAATEKVIDDLQMALTIAMSRSSKKSQLAEKPLRTVTGTLDSVSKRLGDLESKLNERPNLSGVFAAGVAAGGFVQAVPHVLSAFSQIGQSLKQAVSSRP